MIGPPAALERGNRRFAVVTYLNRGIQRPRRLSRVWRSLGSAATPSGAKEIDAGLRSNV
jgi:hypothetical protein